jgi:hypothetical protein
VVTSVNEEAPKAAVRLKGMPLPPPSGAVLPSSHTARTGAAEPMDGRNRKSSSELAEVI